LGPSGCCRALPCTALCVLLPDRYAIAGQMTQRLPEAVLAGCLPLTPTSIRDAQRFTPTPLHVRDGAQVNTMISWLRRIAGGPEHAALLAGCLHHLDLFRASRQLDTLDQLLTARVSR
jgi:hypothetical protein